MKILKNKRIMLSLVFLLVMFYQVGDILFQRVSSILFVVGLIILGYIIYYFTVAIFNKKETDFYDK